MTMHAVRFTSIPAGQLEHAGNAAAEKCALIAEPAEVAQGVDQSENNRTLSTEGKSRGNSRGKSAPDTDGTHQGTHHCQNDAAHKHCRDSGPKAKSQGNLAAQSECRQAEANGPPDKDLGLPGVFFSSGTGENS